MVLLEIWAWGLQPQGLQDPEEKFSLWECIPSYFHKVAPLKIRFRVLKKKKKRFRELSCLIIPKPQLGAGVFSGRISKLFSLQAVLGRTLRLLY